MPRSARKKSESGMYHIMLRGQNRQVIFNDDKDKEKFLQTMTECKIKSGFELYGYCLMGNHIHLLLKEINEETGKIMRRIGSSYVYWYNLKYKRCGHLFQDRYKSEAVETDRYFLTVLRYIHQNPIRAGFTKKISEYVWSSYNDYLKNNEITDIDFALNIFDGDREKAIDTFVKYHEKDNEDICLEIEEGYRLSDEEAEEIIKKNCGIQKALRLRDFGKDRRDECIRELKNEGLSTRQIERLTGIGRAIIVKA